MLANQENTDSFCIHLNIKWGWHNISLQDSITIDQSILDLINSINESFFQNQLKISIQSAPPKEWTRTIWYILSVWWLILSGMIPDTVNPILKVFTWKTWSEHIESWATYIKQLTIWILEKDSEELTQSGMSTQLFYNVYDAKNRFYRTTINNSTITAVWFQDTDTFPIQRTDFSNRIIDLNKEDKWIPPVEKYHELRIVAPITTKEDKKLAWKMKDKNQDIVFSAYIKDDDFYDSFLENHFYISSMLVRVKYTFIERAWYIYTRKEITKVFRYNDTNLCSLPEGIVIDPAPISSIEINNKLISLNEDTENDDKSQMALPV